MLHPNLLTYSATPENNITTFLSQGCNGSEVPGSASLVSTAVIFAIYAPLNLKGTDSGIAGPESG